MIPHTLKSSLIASALAVVAMSPTFAADQDHISFDMVVIGSEGWTHRRNCER